VFPHLPLPQATNRKQSAANLHLTILLLYSELSKQLKRSDISKTEKLFPVFVHLSASYWSWHSFPDKITSRHPTLHKGINYNFLNFNLQLWSITYHSNKTLQIWMDLPRFYTQSSNTFQVLFQMHLYLPST
jgi:hypothetical protein